MYEFSLLLFFFNDTATTEIYTLSLHDALPICKIGAEARGRRQGYGARLSGAWRHRRPLRRAGVCAAGYLLSAAGSGRRLARSEEHTSELQSRQYLVCRLLLEKKKIHNDYILLR